MPAALDPDFDFRDDAAGRDPDSHSETLQQLHLALWSKQLPSGDDFNLSAIRVNGARALEHESELGHFVLSSDTLANSNKKRLRSFYDAMGAEENAHWHRGGGIGGRLVFPRNRIDGKQTLNQHRGTSPRIRDRFDLTLESIRRHYAREESPLSATISRYSDFFALFRDFEGYVRFFHLGDLVQDGEVKFYLRFEGFATDPLPRNVEDYKQFRQAQIAFIAARNSRLSAELKKFADQDATALRTPSSLL